MEKPVTYSQNIIDDFLGITTLEVFFYDINALLRYDVSTKSPYFMSVSLPLISGIQSESRGAQGLYIGLYNTDCFHMIIKGPDVYM